MHLQDFWDLPKDPVGRCLPSEEQAVPENSGLKEARGEDHMGCIVQWSSIHTPREGKIKSSWPDLVSMARRWKPLKLRSPQFSVRVLKIPYWPLQLACLQVTVGVGRWSWLLCGQRVGGAEGPGGEGAVLRCPLAPGHLLTRW